MRAKLLATFTSVALFVGVLAGTASEAATRVALVIANASYPSAKLANPLTDADIVGERLRATGFEVEIVRDVRLGDFDAAIKRFAGKASGADVALFYFAGHGFAISDGVKPRNYLLSVEADVTSRSDRVLRAGGIPLDEIVVDIGGKAKSTLVFVDACRNDPRVSRAVGGVGRGLARIETPVTANIFVGLSTRPGTVAADGEPGEGSPFARAFATEMFQPGQRLDDAFTEVRKAVTAATERAQQPEIVQNDLDNALVLVAKAASDAGTPTKLDPLAQEAAAVWPSVETSDNVTVLMQFRERYAGTVEADLASVRIAELAKTAAGTKVVRLEPAKAPQAGTVGPDGALRIAAHPRLVRRMTFDAAGGRIISVGLDRMMRTFDSRTGAKEAEAPGADYPSGFSPDGRLHASQYDDTIEVRETATGNTVARFQAEGFRFLVFAFSPDGRYLAGGGWGPGDDNDIRVFDMARQEAVTVLRGHSNSVEGLVFLADSGRLLSSSADKSWRIFEVASGRTLASAKLKAGAGGVVDARLSPDESLVAAGGGKPVLRIWNAANGKLTTEWKNLPIEPGIVAWAPTGGLIAFSGHRNGIVYIADPARKRVLKELKGHISPVRDLHFSPDGTRIAAGAEDGSIRIWPLDAAVLAAQ